MMANARITISGCQMLTKNTIEQNGSWQGYEGERMAYTGMGEYQIFYGNGRCTLEKPVIIVDAYDPLDQRDINELYTKELVYGSTSLGNVGDDLRTGTPKFDVVVLNFPVYLVDN
ncbi:MAG: hypothetical protein EOP49_53485, partial [Sphingobacteriales bacterium]